MFQLRRLGLLQRVDYISTVSGGSPFASFGSSVNSIATYFNISTTETYRLYQPADLLFRARFDGRVREVMAELDRPADERRE